MRQALDTEHDLHLDRGLLVEDLFDVPPPVRGLAPCRPFEGDVGDDSWGLSFSGQAVARLPREVTEQDVDLEVLLERLPLEEGTFESVTQRADGVGEDMIE